MGLFDRLEAEATCPFCGANAVWAIQYKYGACWIKDHRIGDSIPRHEKPRWNDPAPIPGRIRVGGIAEDGCRSCGAEEVWAAVVVDDDKIVGLELFREAQQEDENGVIRT